MQQYIKLNLLIGRDMLKSFRQLLVMHKLTLQEVRSENEDIKTFVFSSNQKLTYQPGQYGIWVLKRWVRGKPGRLFTVASPPEDNVIQLSTRISNSDFKQKLNKLRVGDTMLMFGPIGLFTLPRPLPPSIVLVAGGIGITPMRALAKHIYNQSLPVRLTLIHSGNGSYLYRDEMTGYAAQAHFVTRESLAATVASVVAVHDTAAVYYLAGPPAFVEATGKLLGQNNVGRQQIRKDGFLGY